jgi:PAS domain S-box-containing protein
VVENALAGIYIHQDGVFKLVNPKLADIFGTPPDKLLGTPFWQLVQPDDMQHVNKLEIGASPSPAYESRILRKDGTARWIEFRTIPIEYDGKMAILGNLLDITQRKEQEIELLRSNREHAATSSILTRMLEHSGDVEKDLERILADVVSGIGGEVGGIFLQENGGLVLKSLFGAVEDLITFLGTEGPDKLLAEPKLHPAEHHEDYMWFSAPIILEGKNRGVLVTASLPDDDGARSLAFVEKAVPYIALEGL